MSGIVASLLACLQCVRRPAYWTILSYASTCVSNFSDLPDEVIPMNIAYNDTECYDIYSGPHLGFRTTVTMNNFVKRTTTPTSMIPADENEQQQPMITHASMILIWAALVVIILLLFGYIIYKKMSTRCGNLDRIDLRAGGRREEYELANLPPYDPRLARIHALNMQRRNAFDQGLDRRAGADGAARVNPFNHAGNGQNANPADALIDLQDLDRELADLQAPPPPPPPPPPPAQAQHAQANPFASRQGLADLIEPRQGR